MPNPLIEAITSDEPARRNCALGELVGRMGEGRAKGSVAQIATACEELETFRRRSDNLYERVRACMFLFACYRFHLQEGRGVPRAGLVPFRGWEELLDRRYEEAIATFRHTLAQDGPSGPIYSALAECYHHLAFQTLTDQVRRSVRSSRGNQWMFRVGHVDDHSVRVRRELLARPPGVSLYPVLCERTPVRLDLSHSGWSDIFFLGMDYPEGARVLNLSVDLGVHGRDAETRPPIETRVRVVNEPVLRLTSVDLETTKDVTDLRDLFNFGNDYLGL
ncbi:MAG: UTP--glucose-1-phosphate uridylyltransferase, partial [Acidithiobacillales bacterium SM23_46]